MYMLPPIRWQMEIIRDAYDYFPCWRLMLFGLRAVKLISPFNSAYKSVSKRRQLPWDPNMGEEAGELDTFLRFLVMRLVNSLKGKALNYTKHAGDIGQARSSMFMMNNTFYLRDELGPKINLDEEFRIESSWFVDKVNKLFESEKGKY